MKFSKKFLLDLVERVAWTAAQAGLGVVTVEAAHLPVAYAPVIALVLAAVKGFVASKVGNKDSASSVPSV